MLVLMAAGDVQCLQTQPSFELNPTQPEVWACNLNTDLRCYYVLQCRATVQQYSAQSHAAGVMLAACIEQQRNLHTKCQCVRSMSRQLL